MATVAGTNDYSALNVRDETVVPKSPPEGSPQRVEGSRADGAARRHVTRVDDANTVAAGDDTDSSTTRSSARIGVSVNGHGAAAPAVLSPAINGKPIANGRSITNGKARIDARYDHKNGAARTIDSASTEVEETNDRAEAPPATDESSMAPAVSQMPPLSESKRAATSTAAPTRRIAVPWQLRWKWIRQQWLPVAIVGTCSIASLLIWQHQIQPLDNSGTPAPAQAIASPATDPQPTPSADDAVVHYGP